MKQEDILYNDLMCNLTWCMQNNTTIIEYDIRDDILDRWEDLSGDAKNLIISKIEREISFNKCGSLKWKRLLEDIKNNDTRTHYIRSVGYDTISFSQLE